MSRKTEWTASRAQLVQTVLCAVLLCTAIGIRAAEYSEAEDVPAVTSLVFTKSSVALTIVRDSSGYRPADRTTYFIADREHYSFREASEQEFRTLTMEDHLRKSTREYTASDIDLSYTEDCKNKGYRYDSGGRDMTGRRVLQFGSAAVAVEMLCRSSVSSSVSVDDSIWIGTYTAGDHGDYGSEGVLVVPKTGEPVVRLDIGRGIVMKLVVDPWSSNVWVAKHSQLFRVSRDTTVLARYSAYRDFDYDEQRPAVRVSTSPERTKNNPLAVLADWLGPPSHRTLSEASRKGVELPGPEPLYRYAMFGNYISHRPAWPEELVSTLEHAQPTYGWRTFACLLPGDKATKLCTTDLGEWPRNTNTYARILQERYPRFAITGPVFGPKGDDDLRGNRHSPGNFSDDILFGDFDLNGVRDFAAVLIEEGPEFDSQLDEGPIGIVVICLGQRSIENLIEYDCSELTKREPGGFRAELDLVDWEPWADTLIDQGPTSADQRCSYMLQTNQFNPQTRKGNKKLSIMSSFGNCDQFFYHSEGAFKGCQYCADSEDIELEN